VTPGAHRISFMWSYPNMMPLPAAAIRQIEERLRSWRYERIFGAFPGQDVLAGGPAIGAGRSRPSTAHEGAVRRDRADDLVGGQLLTSFVVLVSPGKRYWRNIYLARGGIRNR